MTLPRLKLDVLVAPAVNQTVPPSDRVSTCDVRLAQRVQRSLRNFHGAESDGTLGQITQTESGPRVESKL